MHTTLPRAYLLGRQVRVYPFLTALLVPIGLFALKPRLVHGMSSSVVISQVKIAGTNASDEFVELFNASDSPVDLGGWRLSRRSSSATAAAQNLVASLSGTIAAKGYFLIAHPNSTTSAHADRVYSASSSGIAADNTVILYSDNGQTVVDKLGFGSAQDVETLAFATSPSAGASLLRKPCGLDTDNNSTDFSILSVANPRNSQFPIDVSCLATPTPTPTPIPTSVPTPPPTGGPTSTPVPTPEVTPTPEITPAPTSTPAPTVIPSPVPSPTARPESHEHTKHFPHLVCTSDREWRWFGKFRFWFPRVSCHWESHHDHDD